MKSMQPPSAAIFFTACKRSLGPSNIFTPVCHSVHRGACMVAPGGGHAWLLPGGGGHVWLLPGGHVWLLRGACMVAWGVCVVAPGGMHGCSQGACMVAPGGSMHGCSGGACMVAPGGCVVAPEGAWLLPGGHAWLLWGVCVVAPGGACMVAPGGMHGCLGGHAWDTTTHRGTVNEQAVRILLECILVITYFYRAGGVVWPPRSPPPDPLLRTCI